MWTLRPAGRQRRPILGGPLGGAGQPLAARSSSGPNPPQLTGAKVLDATGPAALSCQLAGSEAGRCSNGDGTAVGFAPRR